MRWAVMLVFGTVLGLYYAIKDELPRADGPHIEVADADAEGSGSTVVPQQIEELHSSDARTASDPAVAPARCVVLAVEGSILTVGPGRSGGLCEDLGVRVFRGRNAKGESQWIGHGRVTHVTDETAEVELDDGTAEVSDFLISEVQELSPDIYLPRATHTQRPAPIIPRESFLEVKLQALAETPGREIVSFGVPFPPGVLADDTNLAVFSGDAELPIAAKVLAPWRIDGQPRTARSVLLQFELDFTKKPTQSVTVSWSRPPTRPRRPVVPPETLLVKKDHITKMRDQFAILPYEEPRVLAILPARWLCDSWAAGPQVTVADNKWLPDYDKACLDTYHRAEAERSTKDLNLSGAYAEQQLDRTILLYRMYFRSGDANLARDAFHHATFYRSQVVSAEQSHRGRGALALKHSPEELATGWLDVKYAYAEGLALHYLLTGDARFQASIDDQCAFWDSEFGSFIRNDYTQHPRGWNERFAAFAWLNWLHAYQLTGNTHCLLRARELCDNVYNMQFLPTDGFKPDGSWRHSSEHHGEGGNTLGSSVWMSAFLIDAIFQHWLLTGDERCPHMLTAYCEFAERYGVHWFSWADQQSTVDMVPRWPQPWYYASALTGGLDDTGGESDHNIETGYLFLMGHYFRPDPRYLTWARALLHSHATRVHPRMFNWSYRASPQAVWFLRETEARSGQAAPALGSR